MIKSPHLLWQYGMIRDRGASYDEPAVHVSDEESYLTYFINNDDYHDLVMVDDVVVVSAQKQQEAGLLTGKSYDLRSGLEIDGRIIVDRKTILKLLLKKLDLDL